jgi:hypothetical protein
LLARYPSDQASPDLRSSRISEGPDVRKITAVDHIFRAYPLPDSRQISRLKSNGRRGFRRGPDVRQISSDICQTMMSRGSTRRSQSPSEPPLTDSLPYRRGPDMMPSVRLCQHPFVAYVSATTARPVHHSSTWPPPHRPRGPVLGRHVT